MATLVFARYTTILTNPEPCKLVATVRLLCPLGKDMDYSIRY